MKQVLLILALLISAGAQSAPFSKGNAEDGGKLHAQQCNACHASKFNGDANRIYLRADRRITNADQLGQRIGTCNAMLGLNLFPEDELNLGAYLNKTFYKFK